MEGLGYSFIEAYWSLWVVASREAYWARALGAQACWTPSSGFATADGQNPA